MVKADEGSTNYARRRDAINGCEAPVGADLSRPSPIYRPAGVTRLICYSPLSAPLPEQFVNIHYWPLQKEDDMPNVQAQIQMPRGKFDGINKLTNERGVIAALAMDQRGSLRNAIGKAQGHPATDAQLSEFKVLVSEVLTPYASAVLLDPEYGLEAVRHRAEGTGVLLAYEETGYDATVKGRLPDLLPPWSVRRLLAAGADTIKLLLY
jgi:hypothetical protein